MLVTYGPEVWKMRKENNKEQIWAKRKLTDQWVRRTNEEINR